MPEGCVVCLFCERNAGEKILQDYTQTTPIHPLSINQNYIESDLRNEDLIIYCSSNNNNYYYICI